MWMQIPFLLIPEYIQKQLLLCPLVYANIIWFVAHMIHVHVVWPEAILKVDPLTLD